MTTPAWSNVQPLVARSTREGRTIAVVFQCPVTGERISAHAAMTDDTGMLTHLGGQVGRQAVYEARRELARSVSRALGGGILGQIGWDMATTATQPSQRAFGREAVFDEKDMQRAVVDAFRTVQHLFRWEGQRWVAAKAPANPFRESSALPGPAQATAVPTRPAEPVPRGVPADHAPSNPFRDPSAAWRAPAPPTAAPAVDEQSLAARMIGAMLHADGRIDAEERALLLTIAPDLDLTDPAATTPPSPAELAAVAPDRRRTLYEAAIAMALADHALDPREQRLLDGWRDGLRLTRAEADAADRAARGQAFQAMVDAASAHGPLDAAARARLRNEGLRLGLALGEVLRAIGT